MARKAKPALLEVTEAVGYIRVSTAEQAESGLSLAAQRARIEAQTLANGWKLVAVYEDAGLSAKTLDRPGLLAALAALRPGRVLLALKLDRLTRSVHDLYELQERIDDRGAEWATVQERIDTTTATGRMMRNLIAVIAEWEREIIAERTSQALLAKRDRKERLGTTPLGYRTIETETGKAVEENAQEMETVRYARQLHAERCGLREIARILTREGYQTKRGGKWDHSTVKRLLETRYLETCP